MRRSRGIRFRILVAFTVFATLIAVLFVCAGHMAFFVIEDHITARDVAIQTEFVHEHVQRDGRLPPLARMYTAYIGTSEMPADLAGAVRDLPPGTHELNRGRTGYQEYGSRTILPDGRSLFVIYDVQRGMFVTWSVGFMMVAGALLVGGIALGVVTARRMARPLVELAAQVEVAAPRKLVEVLTARPLDRELQALADRLVHSLKVIAEHSEREQRFTRFASHELRTPVAVIKGAAELLRSVPEVEQPAIRRPLERIERAVADMAAIIEALLWLAREHAIPVASSPTPLVPVVDHIVDRYRYLIGDKPIAVTIARDCALAIYAPAAVLEVVIGNLVANAFHYTERGAIAITFEPTAVVITDTGRGMDPNRVASFARGEHSIGYGLGLSIVQSMCDRFGWSLQITSRDGAGTRATLDFGSPSGRITAV